MLTSSLPNPGPAVSADKKKDTVQETSLLSKLKRTFQKNPSPQDQKAQEHAQENAKENEEVKAEISELDHNLKVARNLMRVLPDVWQKAMLAKLKKDREFLQHKQGLQAEKMGIAIIFFQKYQENLNKFIKKQGWQECKAYMGEQINRFAFEYQSQLLSEDLHKADKQTARPLLFYILNAYRNDLVSEESKLFFDGDTIKSKVSQINRNLETLSELVKDANVSPADLHLHQDRFTTAAHLKKIISGLVQITESKWLGYDNLPVMRPVLLITMANMYHYLIQEVTKASSGINRLFSPLQFTQIIQDLKQEMERVADVMLWQEQLFQETKDADLFLHFLNECHKTLSPYLTHKQYNAYQLECRAQLWADTEADLGKLFKAYAEDSQQEWVLEYLDFIPKDNSPYAQSQKRSEFVMLYASAQAKEMMQKMLYEKSSAHIGVKISHTLQDNPSQQEVFRKLIDHYCKHYCKMGMAREYLFKLSHLSELKEADRNSPVILLKSFPQLEVVFGKELASEAAHQIIALRQLYLNITSATAWQNVLTLCEQSENKIYKEYIHKMVVFTQKLEVELREKKLEILTDECRLLIQDYGTHHYQFNIAAIPKPDELKQPDKRVPHIEVALLYRLYWDVTSKANWKTALDIKMFAEGQLTQYYLDLLSRIISKMYPTDFRDQLRAHWRLCQQGMTRFVFQNSCRQTHELAKKYGRLDLFEAFTTKIQREKEIRAEIAKDIRLAKKP